MSLKKGPVRIGGDICPQLNSIFFISFISEGLCCVLGQNTSLSQCLSQPRCTNGVLANVMLGGSPIMDWHSIQGEKKIV